MVLVIRIVIRRRTWKSEFICSFFFFFIGRGKVCPFQRSQKILFALKVFQKTKHNLLQFMILLENVLYQNKAHLWQEIATFWWLFNGLLCFNNEYDSINFAPWLFGSGWPKKRNLMVSISIFFTSIYFYFYLLLFPSIFISIYFYIFQFLFSILSIFIADAAFLYLWAKLADWRDHPDDIYTLKLKIKIHEPYIPKYINKSKIKHVQVCFSSSMRE